MGQGARVVAPHVEQTSGCQWDAVITGLMGGISIT